MSLYRFFESYLEESPELLTAKGSRYEEAYSFFRNKTRKVPIENFFDMLFHESITSSSKNLREYEMLRAKVKRMGQIVQKQFSIINQERVENQKI